MLFAAGIPDRPSIVSEIIDSFKEDVVSSLVDRKVRIAEVEEALSRVRMPELTS
jgi:hypothetical protein